MTTYIKDAGVWKQAFPNVKNTVWDEASQVWVKDSGIWKLAHQRDITPPAAPSVTLSLVSGRYVSVAVKASELALSGADYDRTLVLINQGKGYPATPQSSGFVSTPDATYPFEPWSEWQFNRGSAAHPSVIATITKEWPPNPTASTQLPGGGYVYLGAWTRDFRGNWSSGVFKQVWVPPRPGEPTYTPTTKTKTYNATWSQTFNGDTSVRFSDANLTTGYWAEFNGVQHVVIGFPTTIMSDLKNATVKKVELILYNKKFYNPTGSVRYRYHAFSGPVADSSGSGTGPFNTVNNWARGSMRVIDISGSGLTQWKTGAYRGVRLDPFNADRRYSGVFYGHAEAHPPRVRITYES